MWQVDRTDNYKLFVRPLICWTFDASVRVNGNLFTSDLMQEVNSFAHVSLMFWLADQPKVRCLLDRQNATLLNLLSAYFSCWTNEWDLYLDDLGAHNSTHFIFTTSNIFFHHTCEWQCLRIEWSNFLNLDEPWVWPLRPSSPVGICSSSHLDVTASTRNHLLAFLSGMKTETF